MVYSWFKIRDSRRSPSNPQLTFVQTLNSFAKFINATMARRGSSVACLDETPPLYTARFFEEMFSNTSQRDILWWKLKTSNLFSNLADLIHR